MKEYGLERKMEKWLVVLGVWAMCATCVVLFIRGASGGSAKDAASDEHAPGRKAPSAGDAPAALHD